MHQANVHWSKGQPDLAEPLYRRVLEIDSGAVGAYNNLGVVYQEQGKLDQAYELYSKVHTPKENLHNISRISSRFSLSFHIHTMTSITYQDHIICV